MIISYVFILEQAQYIAFFIFDAKQNGSNHDIIPV